MGYEIAREAASRGADVTLISGPVQLVPPAGVRVVKVRTAAEMEKEVLAAYPGSGLIVMAAAVSDLPVHRDRPAEDREAGTGREGRLGRDA